MIYQLRKRTKLEDIVYSLHLYFSGLSLRNTAKAISNFIKRSHTAIRDCWIQRYKPERLFYDKTKISVFIIDETNKGWLRIYLALARNRIRNKEYCCNKHIKRAKYVCSIERFLYNITKDYGKHPVSTDGGTWYPPQACHFLKLKHISILLMKKASLSKDRYNT